MGIREYLPSVQFTFMAGSILVAGGIVYAADYVTSPRTPSGVASVQQAQVENSDWQGALASVQAQSGTTLPTPPSETVVSELLSAAESTNVTDTVARSLLINLSNAKSQGLGDDIPTQEKLVAQALAKTGVSYNTKAYATSDLVRVPLSNASLRAYGNATMKALVDAKGANANETYLALGLAIDYNDKTKLAQLTAIGKAYEALARDLTNVAVPTTLAPLHLSLVNNFADMAHTYTDMTAVFDDPLRGLGGLERFRLLQDETTRLLTNIASEFQRGGILFSEAEPGAQWNLFLSQS